jgi:hypothetical protein
MDRNEFFEMIYSENDPEDPWYTFYQTRDWYHIPNTQRDNDWRWTQLSTSTCVWIDELDTNYDVFSERWYLTETEANEVMKVEYGNIENAWEEQEFRAPKL